MTGNDLFSGVVTTADLVFCLPFIERRETLIDFFAQNDPLQWTYWNVQAS